MTSTDRPGARLLASLVAAVRRGAPGTIPSEAGLDKRTHLFKPAACRYPVELGDPGPLVEDLALDALERMAEAIGAHRPKPDLTFKRAQVRFKVLCLEVFSQLTEREPRLNAAFTLVMGVEAGYIARRDLQKAAARIDGLSPEDRAFAVGMAAGFTTEFLPRPA